MKYFLFQTIFSVVGQALENTPENIQGFGSIHQDPNELGSISFVEKIEQYGMAFIGSTNIVHDENYPPFFSASEQDMTLHSSTPAFTMSISKVLPANLGRSGDRVNVRDFYAGHPVNPDPLWLQHEEQVEIPARIHFKNSSRCADKPITFMTALYNGLGKMVTLRRNPRYLKIGIQFKAEN